MHKQRLGPLVLPEQLETQFDIHGPARVAARKLVYELTVSDQGHFDFDNEFVLALNVADVRRDARIADIGCAYPYTLMELLLAGYIGELYGVEPNVAQFGGFPFWEPTTSGSLKSVVSHPNDIAKLNTAYRTSAHIVTPDRIKLIKGEANELPLDGAFDVISFLLSLAQVRSDKQLLAIQLAKSKLRDEGIVVVGTGGAQNKRGTTAQPGIIEKETMVAEIATELLGDSVMPPDPINAGCTTENMEVLLGKLWKYAYAYKHVGNIVVKSSFDLEIVMNSVRSMRDRFKTLDGRKLHHEVYDELFEEALFKAFSTEIEAVRLGRIATLGQTHRALGIASDRELKVDTTKFVEIPRK